MKLLVHSLGCPKNQVDADVFCRALLEAGHITVPDIAAADAVIINTCGFIESAKEEAIEAIFDAVRHKEQNPALKVLVTGCLAERYREELATEIPEVDAVVGIGKNACLADILRQITGDEPQPTLCAFGPKTALSIDEKRVISTPAHYAWLKISEGCSNACSYCAIPQIRGPLRHRPYGGIVREAQWLAQQGVKEIVLVAQDVSAWQDDVAGKDLAELLAALNAVEGIQWIRLLYTYPERIDERLLAAMAGCDKVVHYLDIPIQHCSDEILRSMRRRGGAAAVQNAINLARRHLPDVVLRTSLIVGYPGETEEQFEQLCEFVKQTQFDRLGCFAYSPEEGTPAAELDGQLPEEERLRRQEIVMQLQSGILLEKQQALVGTQLCVMCDGYDEEEGRWLCRPPSDAPEIDLVVLVESEEALHPGELYYATVTGVDGLDLTARLAAAPEQEEKP